MFGIEWLKDGSVVDRETSVLKTESEVIASAYARAPEVAARLLGHEPDGFRLKDASGNDLGVHSLSAIRRSALMPFNGFGAVRHGSLPPLALA
jgi:hypothetical protein